MKRFNASVVLVLLSAAAIAGFAAQGNKSQNVDGYLVDVMCGSHHASEGATYAAGHTKKCLLMPDCVKSGYAVLTKDKRLLKFDAKGNEQIAKLLADNDREKDWRIAVIGIVDGDQIAVNSIELAK